MGEKEEHPSGLQNLGLSPWKLLEASGSESHQLRWGWSSRWRRQEGESWLLFATRKPTACRGRCAVERKKRNPTHLSNNPVEAALLAYLPQLLTSFAPTTLITKMEK